MHFRGWRPLANPNGLRKGLCGPTGDDICTDVDLDDEYIIVTKNQPLHQLNIIFMACIAYNTTAALNSLDKRFSKPFIVNRPSSVFFNGAKKWNFLQCAGVTRESNGFSSSRSFFAGELKSFSENSEKSGFVAVRSSEDDDGFSEDRLVVLVIGGGGREHALCYALQRSPSCDTVFCAPGNVGISSSGNATCLSDLDISDSSTVISFCRTWGVGLVVVGPEAPLVAGLANDPVTYVWPISRGCRFVGLEGFHEEYQTFTDPSAAKQYIQEQGVPIVIKADGLAAGKGVVVAMTLDEAYETVDSMLVKGVFGSAGCRVIVEEFLEGDEASFFALVDGETAIPLESAQDHKRVGDGDMGPNTGGMGAYSPAPIVTEEIKSLVMRSIILPTVKGMSEEGCKFVGVLFAGLMIEKKTGLPKLIEYNVRFGDPECQVLMVRFESDLAQVVLAACRGELSNVSLEWSPGLAMVVVMARTSTDSNGNIVAVGGRVLGVTAIGKDIEEARDRAYQAVEQIEWPEGFFRRDIGWRALPHKQLASNL
ncbi:ATP-grasp fold [Macleaya cordata]|uniref:phosphoribosylamine--glycine ligase n=1 Tax=Macleaya cordata TaxID=56857 RepID=A0A200R0X7_MACCD|nr:ATP-grasp fold [Macleaya cordata]